MPGPFIIKESRYKLDSDKKQLYKVGEEERYASFYFILIF